MNEHLERRKKLVSEMPKNSLAIIFVSNGPGELATWVNPLAKELHKQIKLKPRVHNSSKSLNFVYMPSNSTLTVPVGPCRCLPIIKSA